ncbi:MAG: coiled-coil domain-containing protein [Planctomycetota bacterium]
MSEDQGKQMISNLRVLDESAYEELAGKLDALIAQAASSSRELEELFKQTENANTGAAQAKTELDKRLTLSARVLKVAKDQLQQVEQAVAALGQRQDRIDEVSAEGQGRLSEFHQHLEQAVGQVDEGVARAVDGLEQQRHAGAQARDRADNLLEASASVAERLGEVQGQLASGIERFEEGLGRALNQIERGSSQTDRASSKLDEQVFALKSRVTAFSDGIEQWLKPALEQMEATRRDAEDARQELGKQFADLSDRLHEAVGGLEGRLDSGLADMSQRQDLSELAGEAVKTHLADLHAMVSASAEQLERRCAELGEQAAEAIGSAVGPLVDRVESTGVSEDDLVSRLGETRSQIESAIAQLEKRFAPILKHLTERAAGAISARSELREYTLSLQDQVANALGQIEDRISEVEQRLQGAVGTQLGSVVERLEEQVSATRADLVGRASQDREQATRLEQRLADLQGQLSTVLEQVDERVADTLAGLESRDETANAEARIQLAQLADNHEQLGSAVGRLEEQVSAARADFGTRAPQDQDQASQLELISAQVKTGLTDLQLQLSAIYEQVDDRVASALAGLESRGALTNEEAAARLSELAGNHEQLGTAVARLEELLTAPVVDRDCGATGDQGQAARLERHLSDVKELLTGVAVRIDTGLEELQETKPADTGFEKGLAELREHVDTRVADALAGIDGQGPQVDGNAAARLSELATSHEQLNSAVGRLEEQLSVALADQGSSPPPPDAELAGGVEQQLARLSEQLAALGARIETEVQPVLASLQQREQDDGVEKSLADLHAQLTAITEQVDRRVADALSELDSRGQGNAGEADAPKPKGGSRKQATAAADGKAAPPEKKGPQQFVSALVSALNSGDPKHIRKFVADEYSESALQERPVKDRVDVYMSFRDEAGEVVLCHIDESDREEIVAVVQETDSPQRHRFVFALEPTPPHKIYVVNIDAL